ncbi:MAG: protein kinase [Verrucomicrobia bacterium]|nr:protein kinase [Verrucomicrobiota bacterium]
MSATPSHPPPPTEPLSLPRQFGDYELLEEIGRGGMGVIYKARQCCMNRLCALKMLHTANRPGDDLDASLIEEAQVAGSLDHPNIVAVFEVGRAEGRVFFSMEYVAGQDLGRYSRSRVLPAQAVAQLARKIAEAVAYAHGRGVMHHDLKPANVVIDEYGEPQITDFGLARRVDQASRQDPTLGAGTPNYMAPEQASARFGEPDVRTDVFGVGAILYYLLTDRPPFRGETPEDTIEAVKTMDPVRPRLLRPGVPEELETICLKCLEKQPARRYQTVKEVAEDLGRFLADEPIRARPAGPIERVLKWRRRHPAIAALGAATALLLAAVAVISTVAAFRIEQARALAEASDLTTRSNLYAADMQLASQAFAAGNQSQVRAILSRYAAPKNGPDLRGWEWRFLWEASRSDEQYHLAGHRSAVGFFRVVADGKWLVSSDVGGNIKVWDLVARQPVASLDTGQGSLPLFAVSPDATRLVVGRRGDDETNHFAQVFRLPRLELEREFPTPGNRVAGAVSPDGRSVWMLGRDAYAEYELASGRERLRHRVAVAGRTRDTVLSPDARWLATADDRGTIMVLETLTGREVARLEGHDFNPAWGAAVQWLEFSADGARLVSAGGDGTARVWNVTTGRCERVIEGHADLVMCAALSADGRRVVTVGRDPFVQITDLASDGPPVRLRTGGALLVMAAFLPDHQTVISGALDGLIQVWHREPREVLPAIPVVSGTTSYAFSVRDGRHVLTASPEFDVRLWRIPEGTLVAEWSGATNRLSIGANADGRGSVWAAALEYENGLAVRELLTGRERRVTEDLHRRLRGPTVAGVTPSPDGSVVLAADLVNGLRLWETDPWRLRFAVANQPYYSGLSPSTRFAFSVDTTGRVQLFATADGRELPFAIQHAQFPAVEFTADEERLLTVGQDGRARIWSLTDGRLLSELSSGVRNLNSAVWSPDHRRIVAGALDGAVVMWDVVTGREVFTYAAHSQPIFSLEFLADESLLTCAQDAVRVWRVNPMR